MSGRGANNLSNVFAAFGGQSQRVRNDDGQNRSDGARGGTSRQQQQQPPQPARTSNRDGPTNNSSTTNDEITQYINSHEDSDDENLTQEDDYYVDDPFSVDSYKIQHFPGAMTAKGRNIIELLSDRSVHGSRYYRHRVGANFRRRRDEGDVDEYEDMSVVSGESHQTQHNEMEGGACTPSFHYPPDQCNNSNSAKYLSPPPHPRQQHETPTNQGGNVDYDNSPARRAPVVLDAQPSNPQNLASELTSFIEYGAATRFRASYVKHLNGGIDERPRRGNAEGGDEGGYPPQHTNSARQLTREQLETQQLLQQHLQQPTQRLSGQQFPQRRLNNPSGAGVPARQLGLGRNLAPPRQQPANPNPSVSTISIAFAPDGRTVASTHGDHTVKVTCAHTGKLIRQLEGHPRTPWTVKYHPTNSRIIASGCLGFQVRVWDWNFQTEAVRKGRRRQKESKYKGRYDFNKRHGFDDMIMYGDVDVGFVGGSSPRAVVEHSWRARAQEKEGSASKKSGGDDGDDDYAEYALATMGIPEDDPTWYDAEAESFNYDDGLGVCLNMIRLNHAIISLSFHPSGDLMAIASGSTLHLWDYNDENKRDGSRQSDALLLDPDRERNADFPRGRTLEIRHVNALRCTHFPPSGSTIIIGSVNPSSSNDGLGNARARRGGMAGGGMSFHLRLWDFDLDAILHPTAEEVPTNATTRVGKVSEDGEITWNFLTMRPPMSNVSYI